MNYKMNTILITGNGFDLHHGLPTKYMDFMHITKWIINYDNKEMLKNKGKPLSTNTLLQKYFHKEDIYNLISEKKDFWKRAKDNLWFQFFNFLFEKKVIVETWIDFENEISNLLLKINEFLKEIPESPILQEDGFIFIDDSDSVTKSPKYLSLYEKINLINKINDDYYINTKYVKEMDNKYLSFDIEGYLKYLYLELITFETCFKEYLVGIVSPLINKIKPDQELFKNYNIKYHYSFNYTNTYSIYNKLSDFKSKHIHGSIEKENIVFGIDDNQAIKNNSNYLIFKKYYRRLIDNCNDTKAFILINSQDIDRIIFFGHSLNKSDGSYVKQIFEQVHLNLNSNQISIDIFTQNRISQANQIKNLLEICGKELIEEIFRCKIINFIYLEE